MTTIQPNWAHLFHAYDVATDTPEHLAALLHGTQTEQEACLYHLNSAILHQGTVWTATAPATAILLGYFADNALHVSDTIRAALLTFLLDLRAAVQEVPEADWAKLYEMATLDLSAYWVEDFDLEGFFEDETAANAALAQSLCACRALLPELEEALLQASKHPNPEIRQIARAGLNIQLE